jgi:hypothetical protein
LKIGATSGLISGIIAGIVGAISTIFVIGIGLPFYLHISEPFRIPVPEIFGIEIVLSLIFGILLGIIFLKAYDYVPGKRFSKYIVYGLFCHLIVGIREATFDTIYSGTTLQTLYDFSFWVIIGFPQWIAYGLVLGFLCELLGKREHVEQVEKKIVTGSMGTGAMIGASVGVIAGIVAVIFIMVYEYFVGWSFIPPSIQDISVIILRFGAHAFPHLIWGAIFGAIFARVYDIIPGKGIMKGLVYSYTILLISTLHQGAIFLAYAAIQPPEILIQPWGELKPFLIILGTMWIFVDIFVYAAYGTLIGIFYKKSD